MKSIEPTELSVRNIMVEDYNKALTQYQIALNQENNCSPENIDWAINRVSLSKKNLDRLVLQIKEYDEKMSEQTSEPHKVFMLNPRKFQFLYNFFL